MSERLLKSESIRIFLKNRGRPDLAALYTPAMEVQVNVAQDNGERVDSEYGGKKFISWVDPDTQESWKMFRIPKSANSEPINNDGPVTFDIAKHAEGIGLTGWDWQNRRSCWFAYDFDAIVGHSEKHQAKLSNAELERVQKAALDIPWVTVRKSTSGNGLHLYVFVNGVETANHTEHAALGRSILSKMSGEAGFDFVSRVDNAGGVMWVWHRKYEKVGGVNGEGLKLIKQGVPLEKIPVNWKDHAVVATERRKKVIPQFVEEKEITTFELLCTQHPRVQLDENHKALLTYLENFGGMWWWDADHHMLVCHTHDLKGAYQQLSMKGMFDTTSSKGSEQNCFAYPLRNGAWVVRRHTKGVAEANTWETDSNGWTRCFLNKDPDLKLIAKAFDGAEDENGSFCFATASIALSVLRKLGGTVNIPDSGIKRKASLKPHRDGRLVMEIDRNSDDPTDDWKGWVDKGKRWRKVLAVQMPQKNEQDVKDHDDVLRHLVCEKGDAGWTFRSDSNWVDEPGTHIKLALKAMGHSSKEADLIMGQAVINRWSLVNRPFEEEYLGDRQWNRDAARFAMTMSVDDENLHFPTWQKLLNHVGKNLTPAIQKNVWCIDNGIKTGGEYLLLWIAALFQKPTEPLPYLFLYGPQGSGKSILHEALSLLVNRGVVRADAALISQSGFNGELMSAILCVVEETDLRQQKTLAYNRIKDWVTGRTINIHIKGVTPYSAPNTTHWIHCSNEWEACPIFPGDTRIIMCRVDALPEGEHVAKRVLLDTLAKEGPDFLKHVRKVIEIPESNDRLYVPCIETEDKIKASQANQSELEGFIAENCHFVSGQYISLGEFYERFQATLPENQKAFWTKQRITKHMPSPVVKGRNMKEKAIHCYGNISWQALLPGQKPTHEYVVVDEALVLQTLPEAKK